MYMHKCTYSSFVSRAFPDPDNARDHMRTHWRQFEEHGIHWAAEVGEKGGTKFFVRIFEVMLTSARVRLGRGGVYHF